MLKQINKISGKSELSKVQQKSINGGLTFYIDQCSPATLGLACQVDGHDGTCVGFACSPNCIH